MVYYRIVKDRFASYKEGLETNLRLSKEAFSIRSELKNKVDIERDGGQFVWNMAVETTMKAMEEDKVIEKE